MNFKEMNKKQIQQKFDEMLCWPAGETFSYTTHDDLMEVMEFAFNLGLEVAADNAEADYNFIESFDRMTGQDFEVYVIKNSILKHKL